MIIHLFDKPTIQKIVYSYALQKFGKMRLLIEKPLIDYLSIQIMRIEELN